MSQTPRQLAETAELYFSHHHRRARWREFDQELRLGALQVAESDVAGHLASLGLSSEDPRRGPAIFEQALFLLEQENRPRHPIVSEQMDGLGSRSWSTPSAGTIGEFSPRALRLLERLERDAPPPCFTRG